MKHYVFFMFFLIFLCFFLWFFFLYFMKEHVFYEKYIWLYLWFWKNGFCVLWNMTISMFFYLIYFVFFMIVMIFMFFLFYDVVFDFLFLCFSFLNNWLENIERTITLHVFYFKHMENSKQTTTFFISHTWRTLNKHWLCIYLFI